MADLEARMNRLEAKVIDHDIRFEQTMAKVDLFVEESRAARARQDADMREMRTKHDADMNAIRQSIDEMGKHVRNLTMTAMGGIIAAGVGIAAIVVAVLLK